MSEEHEKQYLTKAKLDELIAELSLLKTTKRKEVAANLEYAKSLGDLSENAEYQEAREEQQKIESRIARLETVTKHAVILEPRQSSVVVVGATVIVRKENEKQDRTYVIVGSEESNLATGKISDISPLGSAMMNKKKGDSFVMRAPGGEIKYSIVDVK